MKNKTTVPKKLQQAIDKYNELRIKTLERLHM